MANAYSHLHNYAQDLYTPHFDLIGQVLQYKQGKLDTNRMKLKSLNNNLSIVDVAKEEDKEYVNGRLNTARDIANQYAALDLSSDGLTNDLIGKLSSVVDDKMKNAVLSTKIYRSEQKAWAELKKESPDLYNAGNQRFAMQGANAWLGDQTAGTSYNGGGGVIEYDDYHNRWREAIPDIADYLDAEYLVQENGTGMFIDNVTKQQVERGKLSAAMDDILGDKGRQQQMISAWNKYDGADPAVIKEEYDAFLAPKIERADTYIKQLTNLIGKTSDPTLKAQYQSELQGIKKERNSYNSNSFDALASRGPNGVRAAYQTMFSAQEKDNLLYVYSYAPRELKRAVDENYVKTVNFEEKVRHNLATEGAAALKAANKDKLIPLDENGMPTVSATGGGHVDPVDLASDLTIAQKGDYKGYKDLKAVVGNLSGAELVDIGMQLDGMDLSQRSVTIKVKGEDKVIDFYVKPEGSDEYVLNGNREKLLSFQTNAFYDTPYEVSVKAGIREGVRNLELKLAEEYAVNRGIILDSPFSRAFATGGVFDKKIVKVSGEGETAEYRVETLDKEELQGAVFFDVLLERAAAGTLSEEEQLSLDLYTYSWAIGDRNTSEQQSREMFVTMREDLIGKIGYEEFNKLATSSGQIRSDFEFQSKLDPSTGLPRPTTSTGTMFTNEQMYLSDLGWWDSASDGENINSMYEKITSSIEEERAMSSVVNPTKYTVSENDYRYEAIANQLEAETGHAPSGGIILSAEANPTGVDFSGNVNYSFTSGKGDDAVTVASYGEEGNGTPLSGDILEQYHFPIVSREQSRYRGRDGDDALKINLGSSSMDRKLLEEVNRNLAMQGGGQTLVMYDMNNVNATLNAAATISPERKVQAATAMKDFLAGGYTFELASNNVDRHYNMVLSKEGEVVYSFPLDRDFDEGSLSAFMQAEAHYYKQAVFSSYINTEILNSQVLGALDNAILGVNDLLNQATTSN